jgi:radical SAM superfamily enzyme YgiQ (UPF0313 family)
MKVVLIYPPISMAERYSSAIGNAGGRQAPLGVLCLAAYLRRYGHEVKVIDGEASRLSSADIAEQVSEYQPEVIGISSTTVSFHRAREVARAIREKNPGSIIVLGGVHVSACAASAMSHEEFDYGVIGEGEESMLALVDALAEKREIESLPGVAFQRDGQVALQPPRPLIDDLDSLPFPAYDLIQDPRTYNPPPCNYQELPVASIVTSRGCPYACTFCDRSVFGQSFRQRSAENIADEICKLYFEHGVREIAFLDDTFTIRHGLIYDLFRTLEARGLRFPWTCMSRIDTVDRELLEFMRDHGCWHISFGIESGSDEILRIIKKRISLQQTREVIAHCEQLGIRTKGFFMVGHPGETMETLDQSIRFALELPLDDVVVTVSTPIPGCEQHRQAHQYGSLDETDWSQFNYWRPVFVPAGLSETILLCKQRELYRRFYRRPRILWRYFLSFFGSSGLRRFWALLVSLPYLITSPERHQRPASQRTET